jgi:hypothetical protein
VTLDDDGITWQEMARRDAEHYDAVLEAEWRERELTESPEAIEAHWQRVFAADPRPDVTYDEPSSLDRTARFPHD